MQDFLRWRIGDVTVTRVVELTSPTIGNNILPQAPPDLVDTLPWLAPFTNPERKLVLSFHSLIVQCPDQTIVVDTCIGNDKPRSYPRWNMMQSHFLRDFSDAGFALDGVDTVICTHMHVDHVGWNTRRVEDRWEPTFANARYLYAEDEWDHWRDRDRAGRYVDIIDDSVQPIFDAGLADLVSTDHRVNAEVDFLPYPGAYAGTCQRAHLLARRGSHHHRRHDAPPLPGGASRLVLYRLRGSNGERRNAQGIRRALRRPACPDHRHPLLGTDRREDRARRGRISARLLARRRRMRDNPADVPFRRTLRLSAPPI